jgi:hypothetical protein
MNNKITPELFEKPRTTGLVAKHRYGVLVVVVIIEVVLVEGVISFGVLVVMIAVGNVVVLLLAVVEVSCTRSDGTVSDSSNV